MQKDMGDMFILICAANRLTPEWRRAIPDLFIHEEITPSLYQNLVAQHTVFGKCIHILIDITAKTNGYRLEELAHCKIINVKTDKTDIINFNSEIYNRARKFSRYGNYY